MSRPQTASDALSARQNVSRRASRRWRGALALAVAGALLGGPAFASVDLDKIREQMREVEQQQENTRQSQRDVDAQAEALAAELENTSAELIEADRVLTETTAKVDAARIALVAAEEDLKDAEAEAERIQSQLAIARANEEQIQQRLTENSTAQADSRATVGAIARESYKQGGMGSLATTLEILAGETDAVEQMTMARTVIRLQDQQIRRLAAQEAEQVAEQDRLGGVRQDVAYLLAKAEANVIAMDKARAAAEEAKKTLEALEAEQAEAKAELERQKALVEADLNAAQQESDDLSAELTRLAQDKHGLQVAERDELDRLEQERIRKEREAREEAERARILEEQRIAAEREAQRQAAAEAQARSEAEAREAQRRKQAAEEEAAKLRQQQSASRTEPVRPAPAPPPVSGGYLQRPTNGPVTSEFGNRFHPVLKIWRLHDGIDFGDACGTPVRAAAAGTVYTATFNAGLGNYVVIDHGVQRGVNLTTAYAHFQSAAIVGAGQSVAAGQVIGYVGTTGTSTGCHLHFVTRENGTPVNPRNWL